MVLRVNRGVSMSTLGRTLKERARSLVAGERVVQLTPEGLHLRSRVLESGALRGEVRQARAGEGHIPEFGFEEGDEGVDRGGGGNIAHA